mgnify:CR=1 FL=1
MSHGALTSVPPSALPLATSSSMRLSWSREEVDNRLKGIMKAIHENAAAAAKAYGTPGNYVNGANIAGFLKVADSMIEQGLV